MQTKTENLFWQFDTTYWFQHLDSSDKGLSQVSADKLLAALPQSKSKSGITKDLILFVSQFKSPLMLLLIGAVIISAFLGDDSDVFIILFIVLSSGLLSFFQERNAGKVVEKLQSMISIKANVLRDGKLIKIPSIQIVSGDVIMLNAGDMIPADSLLIEANELLVNEASLTGESYPTRKKEGVLDKQTVLAKRTNSFWEGTSVVSGHATALVIQTGEQTVFGRIAKSASGNVETTFEKGIKGFGFFLVKITLLLASFILVVNLLNHKGVIESSLFALALAVGMSPELLPAITTIAMSAGAKRLLQKNVIVKKLNSIQNLGEITLLCTDKTGTITEGVIKVAGLVDGFENESEFVKQLAYWNASLETGYSNPMDEALKEIIPVTKVEVNKIGEVPYDFNRKKLSIGISTEIESLLITKGAFSDILGICTKIKLANGDIGDIVKFKTDLENKFVEFGKNGIRAIGICYKNLDPINIIISKDLETEMIFAGFVLMNDPVKAGITETISELQKLKVDLKIISGDNKNVSESIARTIGIQNPVIVTGHEIFNASDEALQQLVINTHIFTEVEPQQKERIILALKKSFTVAYIGDGINDVSAINAADVGISVENAVDVAREAADFVLMEKDLMVLVEGIKEGRRTFANTLKYLYISTGSTFGNMCSVAAASLVLPFLPMLPKQILLTNFLTDLPFLAVTTDNVDKQQLESPGKWNLKLIRNYMVVFGIHSSLFDLITFLTLYFILKVRVSQFQTGWFIESVLSELFIVFIIRTHQNFFKSRPGKYLFIFSIIALILTIGLPYVSFANAIGLTPLPFFILGPMLLIVAGYILTADLLKVWFFRKYSDA
ncbi:MAG: magnesium-translocating P-type ATPase [Saprospiraceae bacterium]